MVLTSHTQILTIFITHNNHLSAEYFGFIALISLWLEEISDKAPDLQRFRTVTKVLEGCP